MASDLVRPRAVTSIRRRPTAARGRDDGDVAFPRYGVLFFGAMFLGYTAYRFSYPQAFAEASRHTLIAFGGTNTAVLLISSTSWPSLCAQQI